MMRSLSFTKMLLWGAVALAGSATTAQAQWDPWLMGPRYQTSYYTPSFFNGYWGAGYAPAPAYSSYYGPAPACGCCPSACDPCGGGCNSCANGNCASGNCSMNSAPSGPARPIPENSDRGNYSKDTPVPGKTNSGNRGTWDPADPRRFDTPSTNGTGIEEAPKPARPFRSNPGTETNLPNDDFRRRNNTGTGAANERELEGNPDPFKANKPEADEPVLPNVPERAPAGPMDVKEETPVDAAMDLDAKMTSRPVLMRDRFVARNRTTAPSRSNYEWSAKPADPRIARH